MNAETQMGLYGKLPAYGDFLVRNLSAEFINPWDEWLQHFIAGSKEQIGENWLDIYLTSPVWHFTLSPGVIDNKTWAGVMMPSVDRVGRYFPVSMVKPFSSSVCPVSFMHDQHAWFNELEKHCLDALDGRIDVDELIEITTGIEISLRQDYQPTYHLGETGPMLIGLSTSDPIQINNAVGYLLDAALTANLKSFSLWQTAGSELIGPVIFSCQGLPPIGGIASMMDGKWQERNWKIPFNLQMA